MREDSDGPRAPIRWLVVEVAALGVLAVLAWLLGAVATDAWLDRAASLGMPAPDADAVRAAARNADLSFTIGVAVLAAARAVGYRRARDPLPAPWLAPAAVGASLLGLVIHQATVETARGALVLPGGEGFAQGFLLGCVLAAGIVVAPIDLAALSSRLRIPIALAIGAIFVALRVAGSGPAGTGTRINLGPIQPIEIVKPLAIVFLAAFLGARAAKLRWQRRRVLGLRWPRVELMVPAVGVLVLIGAGLYVIGDLGPVLLLAFVFLGMFFVVTRATGWVVVALGVIAVLFATIAHWPGLADVGTVHTRLRMWQDPWTNGMANGHQLGEGLWSAAAGGWTGQGLAQNVTPLVPAGKTDLILVTTAEQLGALGLIAYQLCLGAIVLGGLYVAARGRTSERVLLAGGVSILLVVQWSVIQAGVLGHMPLTGIVVPFLSSGRSSMVAFLAMVGLLARLADDGRPRRPSDELRELAGATRGVAIAAGALLVFGIGAGLEATVIDRQQVSARGIVVRLGDGTRVFRPNPRLAAIAAQIRRGTIADRNGAPLAVSSSPGSRAYPHGAAMGTLLGTHPSRVLLPPWALERALDQRLRGYGERDDAPPGLAAPDLRAFVPLLALDRDARRARIAAIDADVDSRTVRLTIDARLQDAAAKILQVVLANDRGPAAAAVVIDVDTGQVLARVQVPDYDPNAPTWQDRVVEGDAEFLRAFHGAYGEWSDKTGVQGMYQAGSVAKLFTAIAAVRAGEEDRRFACVDEDAQGPLFTLPGWTRPIHDHANDHTHGEVDLVEALAVSCNVYFGQLGLALGPGPFGDLRDAGVDIGYGGAHGFTPGAAGSRQLASTAFGQGAMALSVSQGARLAATIASGGTYRRCSPTMELDATCTSSTIVDDPSRLAPVVTGMRRVMTSGTGHRLDEPEEVRVYGKTGTADGRGFAGEAPAGFRPGAEAPPHSWFVAFAEPAGVPEGSPVAPGRLAIAVVVPRGGPGAATAGPLAMRILSAAHDLGYLGGP